MGWRDALKALKPDGPPGEPQDITSMVSDEPDPDWFKPKTNGTYVCDSDDARFRYLRFWINGRVYFASGPDSAAEARPLLGPENSDPTVGQFTPAGRFSVQRKFERPIVCTVVAAADTGFDARITSTETNSSAVCSYTFEPDAE